MTTETDRELLELAAKAAGICAQWDCDERGMMVLAPHGNDTMTWNPLIDDGDALRLAVKLRLNVGFFDLEDSSTYCEARKYNELEPNPCERLGDDPYDAVRRLILRMAADVGRSMP